MRRPTVGLFETVEPAPPLSHVIKERHAPWAKFESKDEWLVTSDWELTYHFRASPHIYLRRRRHHNPEPLNLNLKPQNKKA